MLYTVLMTALVSVVAPASQPGPVGIVPTSQPAPVGIVPTSQPVATTQTIVLAVQDEEEEEEPGSTIPAAALQRTWSRMIESAEACESTGTVASLHRARVMWTKALNMPTQYPQIEAPEATLARIRHALQELPEKMRVAQIAEQAERERRKKNVRRTGAPSAARMNQAVQDNARDSVEQQRREQQRQEKLRREQQQRNR